MHNSTIIRFTKKKKQNKRSESKQKMESHYLFRVDFFLTVPKMLKKRAM